MFVVFLVIAIIMAVAAIMLQNKANKDKTKYVNRPSVISNPSSDLFYNQKYAIVSLLAYIQGASAISAYGDEANQIVWSTFSSMGLSKNDVEKMLRLSMNNNPDREINKIVASLKE